MNERDELLEHAACAIEESSLLDLAGCLARTKKGQREYELRNDATMKERSRCAGMIRAMMSGRGLNPTERLRRIAAADPKQHDCHVMDAWPLAWKGWLNIECRVNCASNSVPPETHYVITITDEGKTVLAKDEHSLNKEEK